MKQLKIGILPQEQMRARVLAIARGEYKPKMDEPKIWFTSIESLTATLENDNHALRRGIFEDKSHE